MDESVLPIELCQVRIERQGRVLLDIDALQFEGSGCVAIVGPNGSGKTLLLQCMAGLMQPDSGAVLWAGRTPDRARQQQVGLLLQRPVMLRRSALANLIFALISAGRSREAARAQAQQALQQAGLAALAGSPARLLSGGEQQRLALARALAMNPAMLLLDEPTASVDTQSTVPIEAMVREATGVGYGVVIVSHDLGQVRRLADRIILLNRGQVVEDGSARQLLQAPVTNEAHAFIGGELLL